MDYTLTLTFADLGHDHELQDRLLTELLQRSEDAGPALSANTRTGVLTIAFDLGSDNPIEVSSGLAQVVTDSLAAAAVQSVPLLLGAHVEMVTDDEPHRVLAHA